MTERIRLNDGYDHLRDRIQDLEAAQTVRDWAFAQLDMVHWGNPGQLNAVRDIMRRALAKMEVAVEPSTAHRQQVIAALLAMWDEMVKLHPELLPEHEIAVEWLTQSWPVDLAAPAPPAPAPPAPAAEPLDRIAQDATNEIAARFDIDFATAGNPCSFGGLAAIVLNALRRVESIENARLRAELERVRFSCASLSDAVLAYDKKLEQVQSECDQLREVLQRLIDRVQKLPKRFHSKLEWPEVEAAEQALEQKAGEQKR